MPELIQKEILLDATAAGRRLDQVLAELFPEHSRARLQQWAKQGAITVDGQVVKPSFRLKGVESIAVKIEPAVEEPPETKARAQDLPLDVLHEDEHVVVINKPAGLVVHPAAGNPDGTLQNALLHHYPDLAAISRAGIVHRLDRLTSGVLVVARSLVGHTALVRQLQDRTMSRRYRTIVHRSLVAGGTVDAAIGRHPKDRKRMAVVDAGKEAVTHYRLARRYRDFTELDVHLETGRTHQIRVHMAHIRHPVVGDPVYGLRYRPPAGAGDSLLKTLQGFRRQALHAAELRFLHPGTGEEVGFDAPLPADMSQLSEELQGDPSQHT